MATLKRQVVCIAQYYEMYYLCLANLKRLKNQLQ
jgi:hypothetical protein